MPRMIKSSSRVTYLPINLRQKGAGGPQIYNRHISNAVFPCFRRASGKSPKTCNTPRSRLN